ncbi:DVUA0089 family protein [Piscinibacter koreensis]|uniref:PEP-CTERM sorting domain-containing protein n=1 Tax=Piscinibacter koreensis TaxID=2742824 RepID=A0A7Y6TVD6_9BURK|nr:DVUA0089 family protein [Schlegelella koreensis]NUZ04817.1 PEP-CTERM sorting domain-containing protein [Schlegelella koreensis]
MSHALEKTKKTLARLLLAAGLAATAQAASADAYTARGSFARDDDVRFFSLTVSTAGLVTATSIGYAGGTGVNGQTIGRGGFDTMLYLYSSAGSLLAQSDDGVNAATDPVTGLAADAGLSIVLGIGNYLLALTQYDNSALGDLSAGFFNAGAGNFTPALSGNCPATSFCDWTGNARTANWALNITGVTSIPEPASLGLAFAGLAVAGLLRRRREPAA